MSISMPNLYSIWTINWSSEIIVNQIIVNQR
jgi:hypothetical protein